MPKIVILWTDAAMWLLMIALVAYAAWVLRSPARSGNWRRVFQSPSALASSVVLALCLGVTLLDSVHYRPLLPPAPGTAVGAGPQYDTRTMSLLDALMADLVAARETTYSRPLAYLGFTKETTESADGTVTRTAPRLQFGGSHLKDPQADWAGDVLGRAFIGLLGGLLVAALLSALAVAAVARTRRASWREAALQVLHGEGAIPWRAALAVLWVLGAVAGPATALSGPYHLMGTDLTGNDVLYQALKSIRTMVQVYLDKNPELFETGTERADVKLFLLCAVLGLTGWAGLCRLLRAETLKLRELEYVQAAHAFGVGHGRTMLRHIFPNVAHLMLIVTVLEFSALILYEAVLSYVGVGVDPSMNSFGGMINYARVEMSRDPVVWWSFAAAFGFMVTLVLAANLFADGVRDAFDPRSRSFRPRLSRRKPAQPTLSA